MSHRVRVLYLAPSGSLNGGAQIQYRYLIAGLDRSRYEPLVLTPAAGDLNLTLDLAGVHTSVSPYPTWTRHEVLRWRHTLWLERRRARQRLITFARTHAPHIVHGDVAVAPYLKAISAALGIPAVVHIRGSVKRRWVRRGGLASAAALIAIGERFRDELLHYRVPAERIAIVSDATDLGRFRPRQSAFLRQNDPSIAPDDVLFGIVGRIEPFKRQLAFLRAAERVLATGRRARFFVIGAPNPNRPWYVRQVHAFTTAHRIDRSVTFTGFRSDMEQVMPSLDVLVTLSGGSVMLEAMACGVPVVTASARRPDELRMVRNGEAGRVVPARDPDALAAVMMELCDDGEQRRRLGANGRQRAEAFFGSDRLVEETRRVYSAVLAGRLA